MTVQELIAYLDKLPKDTVIGVIFSMHSDYVVLDESDLRFYSSDVLDALGNHPRKYVMRNGQIMPYDEKIWDKLEVPHFVSVLAFPGN